MAGISSSIYDTIFRKNVVFLTTVFLGAFTLGIGFDTASNGVWDTINRGRQWKDIKSRYVQKAEEEDDDDE